MHLGIALAIDLSIALVIINSAAALEPTFLEDEPQSITSDESDNYDQGLDVFTDWNKPVPDTGSTMVAMNEFDPSDDLCFSDKSDKVRAREAGAACKTPHTSPDGTARQDGPQTDQPIRPGSPDGMEEEGGGEGENGHDHGSNNNGGEEYPPQPPISPNKEPGTNGHGNKPNPPPMTPSGKDPNDECSEFQGGIFKYAVCDSGRGPDFLDIIRRPDRLLPGWTTFQLDYCFRAIPPFYICPLGSVLWCCIAFEWRAETGSAHGCVELAILRGMFP